MAKSINNSETRIAGRDYSSGTPVSIHIHDGLISSISRATSEDHDDLPFIAPGLFDIQVNGINGIDFNTLPISYDDITYAVRSLYRYGVTSFFVTLVTARTSDLQKSLIQIRNYYNNYPDESRAIAGVHLEGPFISAEDGPRGAHNKDYIIMPDATLLRKWYEYSNGMIKLVTLAPELPGAGELIAECNKLGIVAAIGHTAANSAQIRMAVNDGARLSTHLGNGSHPLLPRHPNYLWDQLADDRLWASVIADGFHLPDSFLKIVFRVKGNKAILISDSTKFAGMKPGKFQSPIGGNVVLSSEGRLCMEENPRLLAGSAKTLPECISYLLSKSLSPLSNAWDMASVNPARLVMPDLCYGLKKGAVADLILFTLDDNKVRIKETLKAGIKVYEREV